VAAVDFEANQTGFLFNKSRPRRTEAGATLKMLQHGEKGIGGQVSRRLWVCVRQKTVNNQTLQMDTRGQICHYDRRTYKPIRTKDKVFQVGGEHFQNGFVINRVDDVAEFNGRELN